MPFKLTVAPLTKPAPLAVRVNEAPPTVVLAGDNDVNDGSGLFIENIAAPEVPPPGAGLVMVILAEPALMMSVAGTCAEIWVPLT